MIYEMVILMLPPILGFDLHDDEWFRRTRENIMHLFSFITVFPLTALRRKNDEVKNQKN